MTKHPSNQSSLSPAERLANVYDSLADDAFDAPTQIAEEKNHHARFVASAAIQRGLNTYIVKLSDAHEKLILEKGIDALFEKGKLIKYEGKPATKSRLSRKQLTSKPKSWKK